MDVADFTFELPAELIAQEPAPRGTSRLLVLNRGSGALRHAGIGDLPSFLRAGDLLVVNNTRVIAARLLGRRVPSGGQVECLLLGPSHPGPGTPGTLFNALMHPGQKLKPGALVRFEGDAGVLMGEVVARHFHGRRTIRLWAEAGGPVEPLIDRIGHMPLPPYIRRHDSAEDRERYQTVFATIRGSVAAPTAGLHFTPELVSRLEHGGIERIEVTLHVGYGTFKPVRVNRVEAHVVDPERYEIGAAAAAAIARAKAEGRRVIAVGTTTTRALEDAAARGLGRIPPGTAEAGIFLYPGHRFQVIDGLLTNFHLPASSLLMLTAAFAGRDRLLHAYREAVAGQYRFYSYGDAMLIV
ncbi:MAG: tRNA preQ1(34) S-adenosylmethionine ribosyltransferase-isomerase QueA [Acidobacteriota bacterium]|nr:tRNA preQ1(34) S-adenosylmethionine ribosyltransferase-isomerase QueA [Acidobacteriota bacterium]